MTRKAQSLTDHDILIRIDERQSSLIEKLECMEKKIDDMVPNDDEYRQLKARVNSLWDSKNKMIGWMIGAGITGGGVASVLAGLAKDVLAYFK